MGPDATWYGGRPRSKRHCVRWGPSFPDRKRHSSPHFRGLRTSLRPYKSRPVPIVVKWLDGSGYHSVYGGRPWLIRHSVRWRPSSPMERDTVCLCGCRHISTSGLGVRAILASFVSAFAIFCTRYRVSRPPTCVVPRTLSSYGDRTFAVAGPRLWNSLPVQLRNPDITYGLFRRQLKAHLFREAWRSVTLICGALEEHLLTYLLRSRLTLNDAR